MADGESARRQSRGRESREALLQAGVELLRDKTLREVLGALSTRAVARRANRSVGSFFHHWPSAEAYVDDLIAHIFSAGLLPENVDEIARGLEELLVDSDDPLAGLHAILNANFADTANDPFFAVELLLRSQSNDQVRAGLRAFYRQTERIIPVYESFASALGTQPREPFDYVTVSVALTALLEGLVLRALVDPDRVPPTLYGDLVLAFLTVLFRRQDDAATARDLIASLYPWGRPSSEP
jgi:AcrR family transcriptional regulator